MDIFPFLSLPLELQCKIARYPGVASYLATGSTYCRDLVLGKHVLPVLAQAPISVEEYLQEIKDKIFANIRPKTVFICLVKLGNILLPYRRYTISSSTAKFMVMRGEFTGEFVQTQIIMSENEWVPVETFIISLLRENFIFADVLGIYNIYTRRNWVNFQIGAYAVRKTVEVISRYFREHVAFYKLLPAGNSEIFLWLTTDNIRMHDLVDFYWYQRQCLEKEDGRSILAIYQEYTQKVFLRELPSYLLNSNRQRCETEQLFFSS